MSNSLYIFGAGGHTRSLISLLKKCNFDIAGIYDKTYSKDNKEIIGEVELIGNLPQYIPNNNIILSYGDNKKRKELFIKYFKDVLKKNIYHSTCYIDETVVLGQSNFIFSKSVINSNVFIGDNNIINTGAIIEHEVEIGSHNHISVGSIICGRVKIGNECFIGAGAVINDKVSIGNGVTIGSNSTVIKSIFEPGTYVGSPVKKIK